jgi:hypothetical protein
VSKTTGMPLNADYDDQPLLMHPYLERTSHVIKSPEELEALIAAYRIRPLLAG